MASCALRRLLVLRVSDAGRSRRCGLHRGRRPKDFNERNCGKWQAMVPRALVAIFRVVRNSDQLGPVAKDGAPGAMKWPLMAAGSTGRCNTFRELVCWRLIEQGLSGTFIELPCYRAEFGLAM